MTDSAYAGEYCGEEFDEQFSSRILPQAQALPDRDFGECDENIRIG